MPARRQNAPMSQEELAGYGPYSVAELVRTYGSPLLIVSAPENGKNLKTGAFDIDVMMISEQLGEKVVDTNVNCVFDFRGSASSAFTNSRIRSIEGGAPKYAADDFDVGHELHPHVGEDEKQALPTCSPTKRTAIEHSYWMCGWKGQVSGGLMVAMSDMNLLMQTPSNAKDIYAPGTNRVAIAIAVSIDGGDVTQVEKTILPKVMSDSVENMRARCHKNSRTCHVLWCHFPTLEDFLHSMAGVKNLVHDTDPSTYQALDRWGKPATFKCLPLDSCEKDEAFCLLNCGVEEAMTVDMKSLTSGLGQALREGRLAAIAYMIQKVPAAVNESPCDAKMGNTPLHIAANRGYAEVVEWLLDNGADPTLTNNKGKTPMETTESEECIALMQEYLE